MPFMPEYSIGLDLGGTNLRAAAIDRAGHILDRRATATNPAAGREAMLGHMVNAIAELRDSCGADGLAGIGIGVPGFILLKEGIIRNSNNLAPLEDFPIRTEIERRLHAHVILENDANAAALGEKWMGAGRDVDDLVLLTLGTGIGGGIIADGKLIRGHSGFAGEIGHMVVVARGAACLCGGHGCWERYASGGGLNRLTREAAIDGRLPTLVAQRGNAASVRAEDVTAAAAQNLDEAVVLMREIGWWLALGLANLAAILDCGHFVIGGGLSTASDLVLPCAREYLVDLVEGYSARPAITVTPSMFGPRSGAMGAALVAFERTR
jgi:glucokinase